MEKRKNKRINLEKRINKWGKREEINEEREEGEERERLYWKMKVLSGESRIINEEQRD